MRLSLRVFLASSLLCATIAGPSLAQQAAPSVAALFDVKPVLKGIEYETPEKAALAACKSETVFDSKKNPIGVAVRDGQGKLLRKFIALEGSKKTNCWSYYQDGFEVYRESDLNQDRSPDEGRWLNAAGTRIAVIAKGKVASWKRISAEEAAKVLVQGIVQADISLIDSVLATPEELTGLGIPKSASDKIAAAAASRIDLIRELQKTVAAKGWNKNTIWNRLDGQMPHLIPGDAIGDGGKDLLLYENSAIFVVPGNGQVPTADQAFLQVPEMIKIGDTWKFVELPKAVAPDKPVISGEGSIRVAIYRQQTGPAGGSDSPETDLAIKALADYDTANSKIQAEGGKKEIAQFHVGRIPLLRAVVKVLKSPEDQLIYNKQIVDSLAAAYQTGVYPNGLTLLESLEKEGGPLASYAAFRKLSAEFTAKNDEAGSDVMKNQKAWMADLKAFLESYGKSEEAPDALLQLGSASEFNAEEDDARVFYQKLADDFPQTEPGKKGAGALRRLDLVGKSFVLKGAGLKNEGVDTTQYKGKTILVAFWAGWAEPVRVDLPALKKVYEKHHAKDFEIIGVNLDNDRADLDAFLKENPLPWPQIFEPGGTDRNRLAVEYGIIALPTMILIDSEGKVVNRNIRTAADLDRQLEKLAKSKADPVALEK